MKLTHIHKSKYKNWKDYYWDYQFILAKEYYIPLLKKWNYIFLNKKILDIGCGNGGFTSAFGEYCNITGIDIKSFPWKKNKNVSYMPYDIFTEPKKINTDFDLIIMRDVIEHIPIQKKLNFINKALEYGKDNSKLLITFPPFYSPFGLHQQVLLKSIIKYIPFLSSISPKILIPILKILNESSNCIDDIKDMYNSKMTISNFESMLNKLDLNIINSKFFYIRPSHEIRYKVNTREIKHNPIFLLKEFYVLGTVYLVNKRTL
tara:strand:- start:3500 stop:4282 length:783 start_codon:yes stop_codon:yes gene_type:complete